MGKKSKKKKSDCRGYSTTSVVQQQQVKQPDETSDRPASSSTPPVFQDGGDQQLSEEVEPEIDEVQLQTLRRIDAEIIFLKKFDPSSAYRGQLYSSVPLEAPFNVAIHDKELLERLLTRAKEDEELWRPEIYSCSVWNFARAMRVMHALTGGGVSTPIACDLIKATPGYDERAAVEHAILHFGSDQLPSGWCEMTRPSLSKSDSGVDELDERKKSMQDSLNAHKAREKEHFDAVGRAKQLVATIQRENDEKSLSSENWIAEEEKSDEMTATKQYQKLKSYQSTLRAACRHLSKREKTILEGRQREVNAEMAKLQPFVDFRSLNSHIENMKIGEGKEHEGKVDNSRKTEGREDVGANEEIDENNLMSIFDEPEKSGQAGNISGDLSPVEVEFKYYKSKSHPSPQKLLSQTVTDFLSFSYVGEQTQRKWKENVVMGPLRASTAKQLSCPKGTVFNVTPSLFSEDKSSARELTCLRLLFEMIPDSADRAKLTQAMCHCALKQWNSWIDEESTEAEKLIREEATARVHAVEESLSTSLASKQIIVDDEIVQQKGNPKAFSNNRIKLTLSQLQKAISDRRQRNMLTLENFRQQLPVVKEAHHIASLINSNDVTIVCGETGSGKSTQVPQIIIRDTSPKKSTGNEAINIIVTEPRRVAAVSISERVGKELGDAGGSLHDNLCGYTVRLESKLGPRCVIEYVTVGVLLRRIQSTNGACLQLYSHVIVDEVHERSVDSDLLLMMLKEYRGQSLMKENKVKLFPRLVLMSATADVEAIASYWQKHDDQDSFGVSPDEFAVVNVPGRTFPVTVSYIEDVLEEYNCSSILATHSNSTNLESHINFVENLNDATGDDSNDMGFNMRFDCSFGDLDLRNISYDLVLHVVRCELVRQDTSTMGAILVFMPGLEEIRRLLNMIESDNDIPQQCEAVPMHSSLSFQELQKAFRPPPPCKRKLVISTNICETGVTIDDVDLVIDTGFVKTMEWNQVTEISWLKMHRCSIAEATQRRGRAGRVRPGRCIHLFPRYFIETQGSDLGNDSKNLTMGTRPIPEIKRAPLTSPILSLVSQGFKPSLLLSAPGNILPFSKVHAAVSTLVDVGAIVVADGEVEDSISQDLLQQQYLTTPLGTCLSNLPCSPSSGIILMAAQKLNCVQAAAVFVASLDCKSVFLRAEKPSNYFTLKFGKKTESDAVSVVNAYSEWTKSDSKHKWCRDHSVSMSAMSHLAKVKEDLIRVVLRTDTKTAACVYNSSDQCVTCLNNVGMHSCVTGSTLECLHAAITAGSGKNVSFRVQIDDKNKRPIFLSGNKSSTYCHIHPSSLVTNPGDWVVYCGQMKNQTGKLSLLNIASVNLLTALIFVPWMKYYIGEGVIIIGRGIGIKCKPQTVVVLRSLKAQWQNSLIMNSNKDNPEAIKTKETECLNIIQQLIHSEQL